MKIYSMTATFGKLEHETLTLQPGLNIIEAPNEWGKSTWCAFLVAMLYGIETRVHSTKSALADKERYAPWSGAPMSGRMDICWEGRDITIERRSKGRSVFGDFKAYETQTGLAVPELTAANCGQMLLGVEKTVFTRTGFIRLTDLPVTQDDSLRRRLNALVTTGDESGAADQLAQSLRDLKNRVRFNRSGLLPQAEAQRAELSHKLRELTALQEQSAQFRQRQTQLEAEIAALENHQAALLYAKSLQDRRQVESALAEKDRAARHLAQAEATCRTLPTAEDARDAIAQLQDLRQEESRLQWEADSCPPAPTAPEAPAPFREIAPEQSPLKASRDASSYAKSRGLFPVLPWLLWVAAALIAGTVLLFLHQPVYGSTAFLCAIPGILLWVIKAVKGKQFRAALLALYGSADTARWIEAAEQYARQHAAFIQETAAHSAAAQQLHRRREALRQRTADLTQGKPVQTVLNSWQQILDDYDALEDARKEYQRCVSLHAIAQAMAKDAPAPAGEDTLTFTEQETSRRLSDAHYEQRQLHIRLGQCLGQMERLGQEAPLQAQLDAVEIRIQKLEDTYSALSIAQQTLTAATAELQRRFAPRISRRAQDIFSQLTGGRYDRLSLSEDLSLNAGARGEDTLRSVLWRSDGTADQLYLALRLAVAGELTPDAPLVLDDALVRFDDKRLTCAMDTLRREAESKQVLLFTCQSRENHI